MQKDNNQNQEDTPEILIVDDCLFNVAALKSLIMMFDYECDNCSDGQEALEAVKDRMERNQPLYKLIMMDLSMPIMDGPTATREIRKIHEVNGVTRDEQPFICCMSAY